MISSYPWRDGGIELLLTITLNTHIIHLTSNKICNYFGNIYILSWLGAKCLGIPRRIKSMIGLAVVEFVHKVDINEAFSRRPDVKNNLAGINAKTTKMTIKCNESG